MKKLAEGLIYSDEHNKLFYSNSFIMNSGLNLEKVSDMLGSYAEYISDDERDLMYASSNGIKVFSDNIKPFNYSLLNYVDLEKEITQLIQKFPDSSDYIREEFNYICKHNHNELLLKMAFLLKRHLDKTSAGVYFMRGSGVASYIFYVIGLNKVNPYKFGLDYRDFWDS